MRIASLLAAICVGAYAHADALAPDADGWYSWQVAGRAENVIHVRIVNGRLGELHTRNYRCRSKPEPETEFLGVVSAEDNFDWFRAIVEDTTLDRDVREIALHGLVQSDTDRMYAYLERLINR